MINEYLVCNDKEAVFSLFNYLAVVFFNVFFKLKWKLKIN